MEIPGNNIDDSLLAKYLDGSTTGSESNEVESWLAENSENRKVFEDFKNIWFKSQGVEFNAELSFDKSAALKNVLSRIESDSKTERPNQKPGKVFKLSTFFVRVAAVLVIGIATYFVYQNFQSSNPEVLFSATDDTMEILLPDSSVINLDKTGEVKYAENFAKNRTLSLSGEAFFDVKNQNNNSFIVEANDIEVKVLGTSFYVRAYENDSMVEVGVKTGRVEVAQKSGNESIILNANETVRYNKNKRSFSQPEVYDNNNLFWKTAVLEFNEQPLDQVISTLGQVYQTEIDYQKSDLENCNFTGRFKNASLEEILNQLQYSFNIEVTKSEKIIITGKACDE